MKKTLAIILACCLITGCGAVPERYDDPGGSSGGSYISSPVSSDDDPSGDTMGGSTDPDISGDQQSSNPDASSTSISVPSSSGTSSGKPQSSVPSSSSTSSGKPQSSVPSSSSTSSSKPQSSIPSSSSTSSSKPQSSVPSSTSTSSSKPQSSIPSSSSTSSSKPQSSVPSSTSTSSSKPQSSVPSSSSTTGEASKPEIIGDYGRRAPEAWESEYADEVFRLVNEERAKEGLPEFKKLDKLTESATIRAWETLVDYGHDRPDGRDFFTALEEQGIHYKACGENIAAGQRTPQQVVDAWMNSPGHRANILSDKYEYLGVGFYYDYDGTGGSYRYFWAQNFCGLF